MKKGRYIITILLFSLFGYSHDFNPIPKDSVELSVLTELSIQDVQKYTDENKQLLYEMGNLIDTVNQQLNYLEKLQNKKQ